MREIKFRAWDLENKKLLKCTAVYDDMSCRVKDDAKDRHIAIKKCELMQYTGLKDKNGVEIYEGDIILTADDLRKQAVGNWKPKMRLVEWTDNKEYKTGFNLGRAQDGKCEVIGNIWENFELLKANQ